MIAEAIVVGTFASVAAVSKERAPADDALRLGNGEGAILVFLPGKSAAGRDGDGQEQDAAEPQGGLAGDGLIQFLHTRFVG